MNVILKENGSTSKEKIQLCDELVPYRMRNSYSKVGNIGQSGSVGLQARTAKAREYTMTW